MYGITETTVHVTYRPLRLADVDAGIGSVIGVPIPDLYVRVLDGRGQPVPVGVPGEMYVGGAGVARGYLNRAGADRGAFRPRPALRRPRRAPLPDRRSGPAARGRRPRVPRPHRPPGEDPRLPDRAGRDRGRALAAPGGARGRGARARGRARRPASRRLRGRRGRPRIGRRRAALSPQGRAARLHGARRRSSSWPPLPLTENGKVDQKALPAPEARPDGARGLRAPARRGGGDAVRHLGVRAARAPRRHPRQLLRAGRRLDPEHPGHRAGPRGGPAPHPA